VIADRDAMSIAAQIAKHRCWTSHRLLDIDDPALEARWNHALEQVAALEARIAAMGERSTPLNEEQRTELMALGDDVRTVWEHRDAPVQLKKRILRTVLNEIIVQSERESRTHRLILHWAGGVHTELSVERNPSGQHRRQAERTVIDLVGELAKVCPDKAIAAILNRLGYKTGQEKNWNASRVAGLRGYHNIDPFQRQEGWVTREQAAELLNVSNTVIKRLIDERVLPATQVVHCAPWVIDRKDLDLPAVHAQVQAVRCGRRLPSTLPGQAQLPLE